METMAQFAAQWQIHATTGRRRFSPSVLPIHSGESWLRSCHANRRPRRLKAGMQRRCYFGFHPFAALDLTGADDCIPDGLRKSTQRRFASDARAGSRFTASRQTSGIAHPRQVVPSRPTSERDGNSPPQTQRTCWRADAAIILTRLSPARIGRTPPSGGSVGITAIAGRETITLSDNSPRSGDLPGVSCQPDALRFDVRLPDLQGGESVGREI